MLNRIVSACGPLLIVLAAQLSLAADAGPAIALRSTRKPGSVDRVEAVLELGGQLKVPQEGDKIASHAMKVVAHLVYAERTFEVSGESARSVRHYEKALALLKAGQAEARPTLRDDRRLVAMELDGTETVLYSPEGPLTREELDLLDISDNTAAIGRLLPDRPVRVADTWKHSGEVIAALLGLDSASVAEVQSVLTDVADGTARLEMAGTVLGEVRGASTEIELRAKYHFDLEKSRITWFGLLVDEKRTKGHVDNAFEAIAKLQMRITPGADSARLTDAALADVSLEPTPESTAVSYPSLEGGWRLEHDRRWYLTADRQDKAVLVMVDGPHRVAQCRVSPVATADGLQTTLADYQADVRQALGDRFGRFVRASETVGEADYRVYRVVAEGVVEEMPIQWVYYLLTDRGGRQMALAFVVEADQVERFGESDREFVAKVRLGDPKLAARPE